jgi:diacylglycerol kinase (ATP)
MSGAYVIANPKAGKGSVGETWERLLAQLHRRGLDPLGDLTQVPGHATQLAREARRRGARLVVAVGGDGTVHEVVNGLLADGPGPDVPTLGVIPAGSGSDYAKTFDIPHDQDAAIERIADPAEPKRVDVGEVTTTAGTKLFMNIAEAGFGATCVDRAAKLPRRLGGAVYLASFLLELPRFRPPDVTVTVDGEAITTKATNIVVAIGRVFGGGMRVAPDADPSDGLFDVQVQTGSKLDYVRSIPKVFKGTHVPHRKVVQRRGVTVDVQAGPAVLVEADGEVLGSTPASFRILPGALRLKA